MPVLEMERPVRVRDHSRVRPAVHIHSGVAGREYCPICKVWHGTEPSAELQKTIEDARMGRDIVGPFATAREAIEYALATPDDTDE